MAVKLIVYDNTTGEPTTYIKIGDELFLYLLAVPSVVLDTYTDPEFDIGEATDEPR